MARRNPLRRRRSVIPVVAVAVAVATTLVSMSGSAAVPEPNQATAQSHLLDAPAVAAEVQCVRSRPETADYSWEAGDVSDPRNPYLLGIPRGDCRADLGSGVVADAMAVSSRARQAIRIPTSGFAAVAYQYTQMAPADSVSRAYQVFEAHAYAVSPPGAEHPFGHFWPVTVQSVAFGSVPVTFTLQMSQPRDENDLPQALVAIERQGPPKNTAQYPSTIPGYANYIYQPAEMSGEVNVQLSDLRIDGVPVELGQTCRTVGPAKLLLTGQEYWVQDPALRDEVLPGNANGKLGVGLAYPDSLLESYPLTSYYSALGGGYIEGNVSIPEFTGCGRDGEDLSSLVTSLASSETNDIAVRQSPAHVRCFEPANYQRGVWWVFLLSESCLPGQPIPYPTSP